MFIPDSRVLWRQKLDLILSSCQEKISILLPNIYCIFFQNYVSCSINISYFLLERRHYVSGFTQSSNILLRHTCLLYQSKTLESIFCLLFIDVVCFMRGDLIEPQHVDCTALCSAPVKRKLVDEGTHQQGQSLSTLAFGSARLGFFG